MTDLGAALGNVIRSNGGDGIDIFQASNALHFGNTVEQNSGTGLFVARATARMLGGHTIQNNGNHGIWVGAGASLYQGAGGGFTLTPSHDTITGNGNTSGGSGVYSNGTSVVELTDATISDNARHGIWARQQVSIRLARTTVAVRVVNGTPTGNAIDLALGSNVDLTAGPPPVGVQGDLHCADASSHVSGDVSGLTGANDCTSF